MPSAYHTPVQTTLVAPQVQGALTISPGTAGTPAVAFAGDADSGLFHPAPDSVGIATGGAERIRVTPVGQLVLQHTASLPNAWGAHCGLQANNSEGAAVSRWEDNPYGSNIYFQKSRGAPGDLQAVRAGDGLANIVVAGANGTAFRESFSLRVTAAGNPGTVSVPGNVALCLAETGTIPAFARLQIHNDGISRFGLAASGAEMLRLTPAPDQVNRLGMAGAGTGGMPVVAAEGADATIHLGLRPKGGGSIVIQSLPTSPDGLPPGALWNSSGTVRIV
ncbi:hypothetical protein A6A40_23670 (plasmid) [Azospirillum humicireducens]|uniref:Uncharacterized protein n=1 Tax=Azospirillum humicireducens TaxID=1226968 RepID=A0A2R4VUC6_9PROT|nr:hypothetical protein [Azospirillum humicireducens]AWB08049.1 hypothetical protein A6A40_23670 [Azospirillum humicireducens]